MSHGIRSSAREALESIDSEKVKDQAAAAAAAVGEAGAQASQVAAHLANQAKDAAAAALDWSQPRLEAFREWLQPRIEKAWDEGVQAAAPQVEKAALKAAPVIDTAHDKLVEDYLPRLVAAFNAAAASAAEKSGHAAESAADVLSRVADDVADKAGSSSSKVAAAAGGRVAKNADKLAGIAEQAAKSAEKAQGKSGKGKAFWWVAGTAAAAGGAYVVWKKSQPEVDPWAEPWEKVEGSTFEDFVEETKDAVGNAAEVVGRLRA